jgi:branched-chain amino acid transport system substrate-binding protein
MVVAAMEGMNDVDLGGYRLQYSRDNHHGSHFVEITMVDDRGEYVR